MVHMLYAMRTHSNVSTKYFRGVGTGAVLNHVVFMHSIHAAFNAWAYTLTRAHTNLDTYTDTISKLGNRKQWCDCIYDWLSSVISAHIDVYTQWFLDTMKFCKRCYVYRFYRKSKRYVFRLEKMHTPYFIREGYFTIWQWNKRRVHIIWVELWMGWLSFSNHDQKMFQYCKTNKSLRTLVSWWIVYIF